MFNAAQIALIASQPIPKFRKGGIYDPETGLIGGNSHESGGTVFYDKSGNPVFEAEKGEVLSVINKKAVPFYNWVNDQTDSDIPSNGNHTLLNQLKRNKKCQYKQCSCVS